MKFALFFLAEYINLFAVSAVCTTLFLGGWKGPILPPYIWFLIKCFAIIFVLMWFRGTLPRFRIDQMLDLAWKVFVPLALVNILLLGRLVTKLTADPVLWVVILLPVNVDRGRDHPGACSTRPRSGAWPARESWRPRAGPTRHGWVPGVDSGELGPV